MSLGTQGSPLLEAREAARLQLPSAQAARVFSPQIHPRAGGHRLPLSFQKLSGSPRESILVQGAAPLRPSHPERKDSETAESGPSYGWAERVREWRSLSKTKNKSLSQFSYNCVDIRKLSDGLFKATLLPIKLQKTKSFGIHEEEFMNSVTVNFKSTAICWMLITELCKKKKKGKKRIRAVILFCYFHSKLISLLQRVQC